MPERALGQVEKMQIALGGRIADGEAPGGSSRKRTKR